MSEADNMGSVEDSKSYVSLNAMLNLYDENRQIQFDKDRLAVREYFLQHVNNNMVFFHNLREKLTYLTTNGYYEQEVLDKYSFEFLTRIYDHAFAARFRFPTFLGAFKYYTSYTLKTRDGRRYLERYEDRCVMVALTLAQGNTDLAMRILDEILSGRFQPATPTFLNAGKKARGEMVSCFLLRIEDSMGSIGRAINSALQLSKLGGGVALLLSNLREMGAPIKGIENQASGVVPVMKLLEDAFSYANQLGARQGAGAVYLHAHHPDIIRFLDTKRENADEKVRIKSLSLGVVIPEVTFKLARDRKPMHLFSPHDVQKVYGVPFSEISVSDKYDEMVADDRIRKTTIDARRFFQTISEIQFESGYPYVMFEDTVNRANPIKGRITMSNLCTEILQVATASEMNPDLSYAVTGRDISCNLGSQNVAMMMDSSDFGASVEAAVYALTSVSDMTSIKEVPTIDYGNRASHSIGLGQMNLHGYFGREEMYYGEEESLDFTNIYFMTVAYHAYRASNKIARERGVTFEGFSESKYADGSYFDRYTNEEIAPRTEKVRRLFSDKGHHIPTREDWVALRESVMKHGLYHQYLQAVPPTGSISYINNSTSSIHPIAAQIEIRKEGKIGRVYYPAPFMTNENRKYFQDAYEIGPKKIIDVYAEATKHVDQGLSLTLFFPADVSTRDIDRARTYAFSKGIKTIYYIRLRQDALEGTEVEGCVACSL